MKFVSRLINLAIVSFVILSAALSANAAVITVTATDDNSDGVCNVAHCTLREAIVAAGPSDEIVFSEIFRSPQLINLTGGHMTTNGITITGPGSHLLTVRSVIGTSPISRIFNFNGSINLSGMTITGGSVNGAGGGGIAIGAGTAVLNDVVVTGNTASGGVTAFSGGITMSGGLLIMNNCTVSNNTTSSPFEDTGGGIRVFGGELQMTNSTVSGNRSTLGDFNGGGIYLRGPGTFTNTTITDNETVGSQRASGLYNAGFDNIVLNNSIVAGNRNNGVHADVMGQFAPTSSFNLIGNVGTATGLTVGNNNQLGNSGSPIDPQLDPLGNYGGNSPTHALRAASTALDPAGLTGAPVADQRGGTRPFGATADIGAFEYMPMVLNLADSGAGSLRQVINDASGGVIIFDPAFFAGTPRTINISTHLVVPSDLEIVGTGANFLTINSTAAQGIDSRVFSLTGVGSVVRLSGMTVSGGNDTVFAGGIHSLADLTILASHITGNNSTRFAGGIVSFGSLQLINSTVSGNSTIGASLDSKAGGVNSRGGATYIVNSTISGNTALGGIENSGGVYNGQTGATNMVLLNSTIASNLADGVGSSVGLRQSTAGGSTTVGNTIIAANQNNGVIGDVVGAFTSNGWNLIGNIGTSTGFGVTGDLFGTGLPPLAGRSSKASKPSLAPAAVLSPGLLALTVNGGTVPTHGLLGTSAAMDTGNCFGCSQDQRGLSKPVDLPPGNFPGPFGGADIGAFEAQSIPTAADVNVGGRVITAGGMAIVNAEVTLVNQAGQTRVARTNPFGYFVFEDVASGATYFLSASHKRHRFTMNVITVSDELTGIDIIAVN